MQVEIWSDVVCPWCAIGKARFEQVLADHPRAAEVEVRWRSFELDPQAPATYDVDHAGMLAGKYRTSREQAQAMIDRVGDVAAEAGLRFDSARAQPGNTFDAHRILHLAADRGLQQQVADRFMQGYHSEGEAIGTAEALVRLAVEAGLDEAEVADVLAGDAYADAVRADEAQAAEYGISGVPFFVFDGRIGVSGAQPAEVLRSAIDQALPARGLQAVQVPGGQVAEGDACGIDGC